MIFSKFAFKIVKTSIIIFSIFVISVFVYSTTWTPNSKKARSLVVSKFHYFPPTSAKLTFSKNYWASFDYSEPRSMCFKFQYSAQDFIKLQDTNFSANNQSDAYYLSSPIMNSKRCAKFFTIPNHFTKHFEYFERLQGGTIFTDIKNNIVMFEIYLFD